MLDHLNGFSTNGNDPPDAPRPHPRLGVLVSGSLAEGLTARLDAEASVESIRLGKFVKVAGEKYAYFCLVSDVQLDSANADVVRDPPSGPGAADAFVREVLAGTTTFGSIKLKPELMLEIAISGEAASDVPQAARTIPPHFSSVYEATEEDFHRVFGAEGEEHFQIGQPIDMDVPVCINLTKLVQRSNGVFGKSGTGKSFLTRLLLSGTIKTGAAVNLIFDMHSEYGWNATTEGTGEVKGLSQLFPGKVVVFTLDPESASKRSVRPDGSVTIGLDEITVEDVTLLQDELKLNRTAEESALLCEEEFGKEWVRRLLEMDGDELHTFADRTGGHIGSLGALRNKLRKVRVLPFVKDTVSHSSLDQLIASLESGKHVVLEFGHQRNLLAYILVANIITRRLHSRWVSKTETFLSTKQEADKPRQLMITIEEAHKFLNSEAARQTTFGTIARELRKYFVTLLVVDQRPSGIDPEVLSQIGTRITCQLNDERDIDAIFTGVSGASHLRGVLATLDSREQALVLGHAVPMPIMIRTRSYDERFYAAMSPFGTPAALVSHATRYTEIFGGEDD
ncbi:MAG: ATP-binding protein [Chloroflexi bacterium]|nr:ATP-binding protein [Chloroflexota bacterium]